MVGIDLIADLARAAAVVLTVYLAAKAADLVARGAWPLLFRPTVQAAAFWAEMGLGVLVPAILFAVAPLRHRPAVLFSGALMVVFFGVALNRLNVGGSFRIRSRPNQGTRIEVALPLVTK